MVLLPALVGMVAGVPPHGHCAVCATPVELGQKRCGSPECESKHAEGQRIKKRSVYTLIAVVFLVLLIQLLGLKL